MESSKQEMELFLLFPDLWSKNFFYKMFLTFTKESKTGKQEMELSKQEVELFLLLTDLHPKIFSNPIISGVSESQLIVGGGGLAPKPQKSMKEHPETPYYFEIYKS